MAIALATCAEVPELDEDGPALVAALAARGVEGIPAVWDAEVDWNRFDLVVVRSAWDYAERRGEFLDWAARLPRVLNPPPVLRWSTDKRYLAELEAAGVPDVPALYLEEAVEPVEPSETDLHVAEAALAAAPFEEFLYARVDLVHDPEPLVLELELAEPSLYLLYGEGSADRLAELIAATVAS